MELLALGAVGLASAVYTYIILYDPSQLYNPSQGGVSITGSVGDKFVQGLIPFCFAPFLGLLPSFISQKPSSFLFRLGVILVYFLPVLYIALAYNTRGIIFFGVAIAGTGLLLLLLSGKMRLVLTRSVFWGLAGLLLISIIGSDI